MNHITLLRRVVEELDYCEKYNLENTPNGTIIIYFYYSDPVDVVTWTIDKAYFDKHLKSIFKTASAKFTIPG